MSYRTAGVFPLGVILKIHSITTKLQLIAGHPSHDEPQAVKFLSRNLIS